jgi:hypothetical protein
MQTVDETDTGCRPDRALAATDGPIIRFRPRVANAVVSFLAYHDGETFSTHSTGFRLMLHGLSTAIPHGFLWKPEAPFARAAA